MASATLRPERVRRVLLRVVVVLAGLTAAARLAAEAVPGSVTTNGLRFFDATYEQSIPTVFSVLLLIGAAGLVTALGLRTHRSRMRWWLLVAVIAFLALDEVVGFHEASVPPLRRWLDAGGALEFTWVIPAALLVALLIPFVRPLLAEFEPHRRGLFVAAVGLFLGSAIGIELVEGLVIEERGQHDALFIAVSIAQECLEMLGLVLLAHVLMDELAPWEGTLRVVRGG